MALDTCHDRMDFPNSQNQELEVWSNVPNDGEVPVVVLHPSKGGEYLFMNLTPTEARQAAAMLIRGAERIEAMLRKAKP
jgi:hypothetical protein